MQSRWNSIFRISIVALTLVGAFAVSAPAFAQLGASVNEGLGFGTIVGWGTQDLRVTIMRVIQILFGFLGVVAVLIIIYAGWLWMTAAGDPQKVDRAKRILVEAVIGLFLIFGAFAIVSFVIRSLVGATGPIAGGGGPGPGPGPGPVPGGGVCRVTSVSPDRADRVKNSVVRVNFNQGPVQGADLETNFLVQLEEPGATGSNGDVCLSDFACLSGECGAACEGNSVPGTITTNGRRAEFKPVDDRFCVGTGAKCFRSDQKYKVTLQPPLQCGGQAVSCDPAVFCSDSVGVCGALGAACGTGGFCRSQCVWFFETNDIVDLQAPSVNLLPGNICADANQHLRASYSDPDSGVDLVTYDNLTNPAIVWPDYDTPAGSEAAGTADISVDLTGYPLGSLRVRAEAFDFDDHKARSERTYQVRAGHCCNGVQDAAAGELGVDCGGPECGACSGAACDIDTATPACQPNDSVCAFGCSTTSCLCVEPPFIDYISPARDGPPADNPPNPPLDADPYDNDVPFGAVGNLVTIIGRNFGTYAAGLSKVEFTCAGALCWAEARLANAVNAACGLTWSDTQIIVEVPPGPPDTPQVAVDGPIRVTTGDGQQDTTDNAPRSSERGIPDFDVNATALPGICRLDPTSGEFKDPVHIHGIRLQRTDADLTNDRILFGGHLAAFGVPSVWNNIEVNSGVVPSLVPGLVRVWLEVDGSQPSNNLGFRVQPGADHPVILEFSGPNAAPHSAAIDDYLTIIGANFGGRQGSGAVKFCGDAGCTEAAKKNGNFTFPAQCGSDIWSSSRILVKVPTGAVTGPIEIVTDAGLRDTSADTNGPILGNLTVGGTAGPGICKLQPDNGPAGTARITIYGERFVKNPPADSQVVFTASAGTVIAPPSSVSLSGDPSNADQLTVTVPGGAVTGDVRVQNPGPVSSNPLLFTVSDCRSQAACSGGQECCAVGPYSGSCAPAGSCGGVTLQSSYRWHFVTGKVGPRVLQQCTRSFDCAADGYSSPTPLEGRDGAVPVNTSISASIDRLIDPSTVTTATVIVEDCGVATVAPACAGVPVNLVSTLSTPVWTYHGTPAHKIEVTVSPFAPGQPFQQNRWFRVTLRRDIRSPSGEQLVGNDTATGHFVWYFRTRDNTTPASIGCLACDPEQWALYSRYDGTCNAGDNDCVPLLGSAYSDEQACVLLDPGTYTWSFTSDDPARVGATSVPLGGPIGAATALGQTSGTPVRVRITGQPGKEAVCKISVDLATPVVVQRWPDCQSACPNAQMGVRFSLPMENDAADANRLSNTNHTKLYVCGLDYTCALASALQVSLVSPLTVSAGDTIATFQPVISHNGGRLIPGVYYRVVLDSDTDAAGADTGLTSTEGKGLGKLNFDADGNGTLDSYSWVFKVQENFSLCAVSKVDVSPPTVTAYPPQRVPYTAIPRKTPDACDPLGQRLDPFSIDWLWASSAAGVAAILGPAGGTNGCGNAVMEAGEECDNGPDVATDNCDATCVVNPDTDTGNTVRPGSVASWACGNGIVENDGDGIPENGEEQCDDGNLLSGDGCGVNCQLEGPRFGRSVCGDGIVGPGEACEVCGAGAGMAPIWYGSCASSDFANNRRPRGAAVGNCATNCTTTGIAGNAQPAPISVCGNRTIESGEECDTGEYGGDNTDGCTDSCLLTGTVSTITSPHQLVEAVAAGTANITAADGSVVGRGTFIVPTDGTGGAGGPFRIVGKQPEGTTPACLNEVIVVRFSAPPDIASVRTNVRLEENGAAYTITAPGTQILLNGTTVTITPNGSRWAQNATYEVDLETNAAAIVDSSARSLVCRPGECRWTFQTGTQVCRATDVEVDPAFALVRPNAAQDYLASLVGPLRSATVVGGLVTRNGAGVGVPTLGGALGCSANAFICTASTDSVNYSISAHSANDCAAASRVSLPGGFLSASRMDSSGTVVLGCGIWLSFSDAAVTRTGTFWMDVDPAQRVQLAPTVNYRWKWTEIASDPAIAGAPAAAGANNSSLTVTAVAQWTPFVGARQADIEAFYDPDGVSGLARFAVGNLCQLPYRSGTRYHIYPLQPGVDTTVIGHFDGVPRLDLGNGRTLEPVAGSGGYEFVDGLTDGGTARLGQGIKLDNLPAPEDLLTFPAQGLVNPRQGSIAVWFNSLENLAVTRALVTIGPVADDLMSLVMANIGAASSLQMIYNGVMARVDVLGFISGGDEWHLAVGTWEIQGSDVVVRISVDGLPAVVARGAATEVAIDAATQVRIGRSIDIGSADARSVLDELEISQGVMDEQEIEARYQAVAAQCISGASVAGAPQVDRCTPSGTLDACTDAGIINCSSPLISVTFDGPMDRESLLRRDGSGYYDNVLLCNDTDYTDGSGCMPDENLIQELAYNPISERLSVVRPTNLPTSDTADLGYHMVLKVGADRIVGVSGLPLNGGIGGDGHWTFAIARGARQCRCDAVRVWLMPKGVYGFQDEFACAGNTCQGDLDLAVTGNQHAYDAECYDRSAGQPAASVTYQWREAYDVNGAVNLSCAAPPCTSATALDDSTLITTNTFVNGEARAAVVATGAGATQGRAEQLVDITNFVCANPWPDPWVFPWKDTSAFPIGAGATDNKAPYTNFELFYCRDLNSTPSANDDLPPVQEPPTVRASSLPKQFLFPLNYFQETQPIQVLPGLSLVAFNGYYGPLSVRTGNEADATCAGFTMNLDADGTYSLAIPETGHYQVAFEILHVDNDFEPPSTISISLDGGATWGQTKPGVSLEGRQILTFDLGQQSAGAFSVSLSYDGTDASQGGDQYFGICRIGFGKANIKHDVIGVQVLSNPWRVSPGTWYASGICSTTAFRCSDNPGSLTECAGRALGATCADGSGTCSEPEDIASLKGLCFGDADCVSGRCLFNVPNRGKSPQSAAVDGYPAIRDGRTVYAGATNLVTLAAGDSSVCENNGAVCAVGNNAPCAGGVCQAQKLFANIYLMSYNDGAGEQALSVFDELSRNWKFNTDLTSVGACAALSCSEAGGNCVALRCSDTGDVFAGCAAAGNPCDGDGDAGTAGMCIQPGVGSACGAAGTCGNVACSNDLDCPGQADNSCLNPQSKIRRDAIRFGQLQDLQLALRASSRKRGGGFPLWDAVRREFTGGTYVPGHSFSVWPSWTQTFAQQLGGTPPTDPLNQFVGCIPPYDSKTCWDEQGLRFGCPLRAYVYGYSVDAARNGQGYRLYTRLEFPKEKGGWRETTTDISGMGAACFNFLALGESDADRDGVRDDQDSCLNSANPYVCRTGPQQGELCPRGPAGTECGVGNECWQPDSDNISGVNLAQTYGIIPAQFAADAGWSNQPCVGDGDGDGFNDSSPDFTIDGDRYDLNQTYCTIFTGAAANNPFWLGQLNIPFTYDTITVYVYNFTGPVEVWGADVVDVDPTVGTQLGMIAFADDPGHADPRFQVGTLVLPDPVRYPFIHLNRTVNDVAFDYDRIQEVEVYNNSGGDGVGDSCDPCPHSVENDLDHDGVCENGLDNPQYGYRPDNCVDVPNPDQRDADNDNTGDACDTNCAQDLDRDGICDAIDNCPTVYNPTQANGDGAATVPPAEQRSYCVAQVDIGGGVIYTARQGEVGRDCTNPPSICLDAAGVARAQLCQLQSPDVHAGQVWPNGREWGDACDLCTDPESDGWGSGLPAETCRRDNCQLPTTPLDQWFNPGQEDYDNDGIGYRCDSCIDTDNDQITDQLIGNSSFEDGLNGWQMFASAGADAHLRQATDYRRLSDFHPSNNHDRAYRGVHSAEILIQNLAPGQYLALRSLRNPQFLQTSPDYPVRYVMQARVRPSDEQMVGRLRFRPIRACTHFQVKAAPHGLEYRVSCQDPPDLALPGDGLGFRVPLRQPVQVQDLGSGWYTLRSEFAVDRLLANDPIAFELALENGVGSPVTFGNNAALDVDDFTVGYRRDNEGESCLRPGWPVLGWDPGQELFRQMDNCGVLNNPTRCVGGRFHGAICNNSADCVNPPRGNVKALTLFEQSGEIKSFAFDVSGTQLTTDINEQNAAGGTGPTGNPAQDCDLWTSEGECYDLFWSNDAGGADPTGLFLSIEAYRTPAAAAGHNVDAVRLDLVTNAVVYAQRISGAPVVEAGSTPNTAAALGSPNSVVTALGDGATKMVLDFGLAGSQPFFASCLEILRSGMSADGVAPDGNNWYQIDVNRDGTADEQVYCDMTTDGGGWTMVARFDDSDVKHWTHRLNSEMGASYWFDGNPHNAVRGGTDDYKARAFETIPVADVLVTIHPDTYSFPAGGGYTPGAAGQEVYAVWRNGIADGLKTFADQSVWKAAYCPQYDPDTVVKSGSRGTGSLVSSPFQCGNRPTLKASTDTSASGDFIAIVERFRGDDVALPTLYRDSNAPPTVAPSTRNQVHSILLRNWHDLPDSTNSAFVRGRITFSTPAVNILGWAIDNGTPESEAALNELDRAFSVTGGLLTVPESSTNRRFEIPPLPAGCWPDPGCAVWNNNDFVSVTGALTAEFGMAANTGADDARLLFTYDPAAAGGPITATVELDASPQPAVHGYLQDLVVCDREALGTAAGGAQRYTITINEMVDPVRGIVFGPRDSDRGANVCVKKIDVPGINNDLSDPTAEGDEVEISVLGLMSYTDILNPGPQGLGNWYDGGAGGGAGSGTFNDFTSINAGTGFPLLDAANYGQLWFRERPVFTGASAGSSAVPGATISGGVGVCMQPDYDEDNVGDLCDRCTDRDNDRFGDAGFNVSSCAGSFFKSDNCPATYNPDQADYDQDAAACRYDTLQPYVSVSSDVSVCNDSLGFALGGTCQFCGGDACDLDADGDACYNWEQLKRQPGHDVNSRLYPGRTIAELPPPNYRVFREEGYARTLAHDEVSWRSFARDADVDGIADDCDAQACGNREVENVRQAAPLTSLTDVLRITVYEISSAVTPASQYPFAATDSKLRQQVSDADGRLAVSGDAAAQGRCDAWTGANECYDFFFSNADGTLNPDGGYFTSVAWRDPALATDGNNLDAVKLEFTAGSGRSPIYASRWTALFTGVCDGGTCDIARPDAALGPPDCPNPFPAGPPHPCFTRVGDDRSSITLGFDTEDIVNQCFDPVRGVQTCEECDSNNFNVGSNCDKPYATGSSATYRQIYPLQRVASDLFLAHFDGVLPGALDARRGDGSVVRPMAGATVSSLADGLTDGSLDAAGNPVKLGQSLVFNPGDILVYDMPAGANNVYSLGNRSVTMWVNVRDRVDELTLADISAARIELGTAWQAGSWHHVAVTWNSTDTDSDGTPEFDNVRLFLDGLPRNIALPSAEVAPPPNLDISWWLWVLGLHTSQVWLDELEFRSEILTDAIISARVSAIRNQCLGPVGESLTPYMVDNFCASCNNLRCQIETLRTCMPIKVDVLTVPPTIVHTPYLWAAQSVSGRITQMIAVDGVLDPVTGNPVGIGTVVHEYRICDNGGDVLSCTGTGNCNADFKSAGDTCDGGTGNCQRQYCVLDFLPTGGGDPCFDGNTTMGDGCNTTCAAGTNRDCGSEIGNPSRTAVNVEAGQAWVVDRASQKVVMLDEVEGVKKVCKGVVGNGSNGKGVTIDSEGFAWVGEFDGPGRLFRFDNSDDECTPERATDGGLWTYGLVADQQDNVWISGRSQNAIWRIRGLLDPGNAGRTGLTCGTDITCDRVDRGGIYGIAVDLDGRAWVGNWEGGGADRVNSDLSLSRFSNGATRGVGITTKGNMLLAQPGGRRVRELTTDGTLVQDYVLPAGNGAAYGTSGDSMGCIWAISESGGSACRVVPVDTPTCGANPSGAQSQCFPLSNRNPGGGAPY
ncbi:MAG: Ig-like domain-containing protein, partial [bacterium]|nr:Ig-like domain-containing protein [bacterium]